MRAHPCGTYVNVGLRFYLLSRNAVNLKHPDANKRTHSEALILDGELLSENELLSDSELLPPLLPE